MTVNVFGSSSAPSELKAFSEPDRDDFSMLDHVGKAAIFEVQGIEQVTTNRYGVKPAVKTNVVILGDKPERFENVLIFNKVPVDQLGPAAGQLTVAIIDKYVSKQGSDSPKLVEPTQAAIDAANAYIKENAK